MIREEAIAFGKRVIDLGFNGDTKEFCELAINALEQEPCGDCISREKTLQIIRAWFDREATPSDLKNEIEQLPPVTPRQELGKWKAFTHSAYRGNDEDGEPIWREVTVYHCDLCNRRTVIKEKYCPNCGRKMQEVEK